MLKKSADKIGAYLKLDTERLDDVLRNAVVREKSSGYNNQICIVDFFDSKGGNLGGICLKRALSKETQSSLVMEADIMELFYLNKVACPRILDLNTLENNTVYIVMEAVKGNPVNLFDLSSKKIQTILDLIRLHESKLARGIRNLRSLSPIGNLRGVMDFENKVLMLLAKHVPGFSLEDSLGFLNVYLNDEQTIRRRTIVTDRSSDNIFQDENGNIVLIDFSTIRIGSQFDNWIQLIDDPRANFYFKREDLIKMFFGRNKLDANILNSFQAASVYTNLLQGIFTYEKNRNLAAGYFKNANKSFMKLTNKKNMLIRVNH
jgi:serine/threonine protein kinase